MSARAHTDRFLAFIAAVAAAKETASAEQLADLQHQLVPKLQKLLATKDAELITECDDLLFKIMGPTWAPTGQWAEARANAHQIINDGIRERGHEPSELFAPKDT